MTNKTLSPSLRASEATEAIQPQSSLRADEIGAAIHKPKADSSVKVDCHDLQSKSRNDNKKADSNDNAPFPSLRGSEATEAIQPQSSLRADEIGAAIHKQKELESKIDSLVYKLYNLTNDEIEIVEYY